MSAEKKLNNLLGMKQFSEKDFFKNTKATKRTDVAKDILEGKEYTGKDVFGEKPKSKDEIKLNSLNNLISLDEYTEKETMKDAKATKRTSVAKDILQEKAKAKKKSEPKKEEKEVKKSGLSAAQKKLPPALQAAILKRQKK